jgi:hypothetical protein
MFRDKMLSAYLQGREGGREGGKRLGRRGGIGEEGGGTGEK